MQTLRATRIMFAVLSAVSLLATACKDTTGDDEPEPAVTGIRLTFGAQAPVTYTGAAGENRSVHIPVGATQVTAAWLRADGTVDPFATTTDFTLRVVPAAGSPITYTPSSSANTFSGTLTASGNANNVAVTFALLHVAEQHEDFGPITVNVSVP